MIDTEMITPPRVGIVILNWNGCIDTVACLESLAHLDYPSHQIIVVDNGSADASVARIRTQYTDVKLIETGRNLGYAGGNNVGLKYALGLGCDFALLLNNDTICPPDFLRPLVDALTETPHAAFAGPVIYYNADRQKIWSAGARWSATQSRLVLSVDLPKPIGDGATAEVESLVGCALLVRLSALEQIGLLDEGLFLLHEESDWCARARALGARCVLALRSKIWHSVSASFGGAQSPLMHYFDQRNTLYWAERHLPKQQFIGVVGAHARGLIGLVVSVTQQRAARVTGKRVMARAVIGAWSLGTALGAPMVRARAMGFLHYLLRVQGDCPTWVRALPRETGASQ